jgi:hypothetical protein
MQTLPHSRGMLYMPGVFKPRTSLKVKENSQEVYSLMLCSNSTPFLLGPFAGPFPPMHPIGSFLHYNSPCICFSLGPVQGTFLQHVLLAYIITHLTPTPPHTWPISMSSFHSPHTSTLKMEAAQSSNMLVSNHHTTQCNNPESHKFYDEYRL